MPVNKHGQNIELMLKPKKIKTMEDQRGVLSVLMQNRDLPKNFSEFGQIYFVNFNQQGVIRGNHYHKEWHEWTWVLDGKIKAYIQDVKTGDSEEYILDSKNGKSIARLEIPPFIAHTFVSVSDSAILLSYTNIEWNENDTFTKNLV